MASILKTLSIGFTLICSHLALGAEPYEVKQSESILAVITHRAGFASGMAHNHLVFPKEYQIQIQNDENTISSINIVVPTKQLVIDEPEAQKKYQSRLIKLQMLSEPYSDVSPSDRADISKSMFAKDQLNVNDFDTITAEVKDLRPINGKSHSHEGTLTLTIRGKTKTRPIHLNLDKSESKLRLEGWGDFKFSDFGIEPFSAFLGAVKNQDRFDVYCSLIATR